MDTQSVRGTARLARMPTAAMAALVAVAASTARTARTARTAIRATATVAAMATVAATAVAAPPATAGNAAWTNQVVRVQVGADRDQITGKTRTLDRCLYVQLDRAAPGGVTLVRMDQVSSLHVRNGTAWVARDLKSVLAREPAHCFAEANG